MIAERARSRDPRRIVTAEAFELAPELLGAPLAPPARRLGAVLVDLALIGLLSQAGGLLLGVAATVFFIYLARGREPGDALARAFRLVVGCFGAVVLLITGCALFFAFGPDWEDVAPFLPADVALEAPAGTGEELGLSDILQGTQEFRRLHRAETEAEAREAAARVARRLRRLGAPTSEIPDALREMAPSGAPWSGNLDRIVAAAVASLDTVTAADTATPSGPATDTVRAAEPLADTVRALLAALEEEREDRVRAERRLEEARQELQRARDGWFLGWVRTLWDDLGLAFGWGAIYMTIFLSWWNGRTPGKKLFGIRVVQLDNSPISWWEAFERAGGYAAGLATGLLGFAQVYWDPNRQAIHDKISETVVLLEAGGPAAAGRDGDAGGGAEGGPRDAAGGLRAGSPP